MDIVFFFQRCGIETAYRLKITQSLTWNASALFSDNWTKGEVAVFLQDIILSIIVYFLS